MVEFSMRSISINLRGDEWFAVFAKLTGRKLSPMGQQLAREAMHEIARQLDAAANEATFRQKTDVELMVEANERVSKWPGSMFQKAATAVPMLAKKFPIGPSNGRRAKLKLIKD